MPLASTFFLILLLLGLKIFSTVKGTIAVFSPSLTYLHLLFILLLCISQRAAALLTPSWLICSCGGCMEELHCGWHSELQTALSDPYWSKNLLPRWWCLRVFQEIFRKKGLLITQNRGDALWKMGHMRLQEVLCSIWARKSLSLPTDTDYILAVVPMTGW